jgi:Stress responsive A/B Barrel Domain
VLRHLVMFRWHPEVEEERIETFLKALEELLAGDPYVRSYRFGLNSGVREDNFDFALVADFDNLEDYLRYEKTARHDEFVKQFSLGIVSERVAVQHALTS